MKKLSIKSRVALWYAFSLLAILALVAALLLAAGDRLITGERTSNLITVTDRAVKDVRIQEGKMVIDDDIVYYSDGAYVVVYRDDGTLISGLEPEGFPDRIPYMADQVRRAKAGEKAFFVYDRLIENQKVGKIWVRGISSARWKDIAPSVMRMLNGFLIAIPILFIIALTGGWFLTRQAFAPLKQIVNTAETIRKGGDLTQRIGFGSEGDSDEIRRTAAIFDDMLGQIENDFEKEKQFTNNASHELRTPIAVILAQSEYAMENMDQTEEVKESLYEIHHQACQMSSLVNQLLTLARADRHVDQVNKEITDISLLAEESAERLHHEALKRGITIRVQAQECAYMNCDPLFMGRLFDNLIENSLKYGRTSGTTEVIVRKKENDNAAESGEKAGKENVIGHTGVIEKENTTEQADKTGKEKGTGFAGRTGKEKGTKHVDKTENEISTENVIEIQIRDDGMGIHEEDLPRIWDRFYRGKHRHASHESHESHESHAPLESHESVSPAITFHEDDARSVGLGLSLVAWIVEAHHGQIRVESTYGKGTTFYIRFPELPIE